MENQLSEIEKQIFFQIESMRDGCCRDVLREYIKEKNVDASLDELIKKEYVFETSDLLFINYDKIDIDTWVDVKIK